MKANKRRIKKWCTRSEQFVRLSEKRGKSWVYKHIDSFLFMASVLVPLAYRYGSRVPLTKEEVKEEDRLYAGL